MVQHWWTSSKFSSFFFQFVGPDGHPTHLYRKEMSTNDFSKSGRVGYYRQAMVLSREGAINKTDLNSFPQGLIDMTMEAGMTKTFQNGPWRDNADSWAEYILKTRDLQILLAQWQALAPQQCVLVRWDSDDVRHELGEVLFQPLSEYIIFPDTISTFVGPSSIPSYSSPYFSAVPSSSSCIQGKVFSLQSLHALSTVSSYFSNFFGCFYSLLCPLYE